MFFVLPLGDLVDELLGELKLVLAGFDVCAAEAFDVILIEDGFHRLDLAQRLFELVQQLFLENAGIHRGVVGGVREDVPRSEDEIFQLGERDEIFD